MQRDRSSTAALTLLGVAFTLLAAAPAHAQAPSPHEATATAAYEAGDLDTALREFEAAYLDAPRADLLYVIGRLHSERKDCAKAIDYFKRYLLTRPGETQSDAAQAEIAKCQSALDAQRPADTTPPPVDTGTGGNGSGGGGGGTTTGPVDTGTTTGGGGTTVTASTSDASTSFTSDKLGLGLLIGGVLAEGTAVVFIMQARNAQCGDPVCTELSYDEYLDAEDKAKTVSRNDDDVSRRGSSCRRRTGSRTPFASDPTLRLRPASTS